MIFFIFSIFQFSFDFFLVFLYCSTFSIFHFLKFYENINLNWTVQNGMSTDESTLKIVTLMPVKVKTASLT